MTDLRDQIALVTGASGAIGGAIARALGAAGARLVLAGRDAARLRMLAEELRGSSPEIDVQAADLADEAALRRLATRVLGTFGGVDLLVHSAGLFVGGKVADVPLADLDRQLTVNLRAPYLLTQLLLPSLIARRGQIVFINSSAGRVARGGVASYAASKWALKGLADGLRDEVNGAGVRVLTVFPARTASAMQVLVRQTEGKPYEPEKLLQPEDVAAVTLNALLLPRRAEVTDVDVRQMVPV
ncbi:MAG TPA: SDR family NAD(P)-dependent oxidoreductase [Thermoanaerobaculia bacterium]|nr:SDR family NAD(P)-dependent oxidoreductase [Thermoanaerobaculia bacterium]